jgi:tetratricopeptide (TPR) repeat protein
MPTSLLIAIRSFSLRARLRFQTMQRSSWSALSRAILGACMPLCLAQGQPAQDEVGPIASALRNHEFAQALSLSKTALAAHPTDYRIWTLRGMATGGMGDLPQALSAYQHALKLAPSYLPALEGAAQSEFQMGRESAKPLLLKILAQRPDDPTSHALLGVLEYRNKNCGDAVGHFQKATEVIASQPEALTEYGSCLATLGHADDAVAVFTQALASVPAKPQARYNLALAQWDAHHSEDAMKTLRPLLDSTPADGDALTLAAEILESESDTPHAVEVLRKAILANPKNVEPYLQFAALSYDHSSAEVGIDILDAGLTQLPKEPRLYLVRGILLTQLGEFPRAANDFETASRFDPQLSFLGVAKGLVRSQQHRSAEALAEFRRAAKTHPSEAYAQYLLAEALQGEVKSVGSPEYKEEVEAAARAVKLDPSLVAARDLLSSEYLEYGQIKLAIEQSRAALALDPNDQQAVYHLILALRKTDQRDQVPALLKRLVELRANTREDDKARKGYRLYETPAPTSPAAP